LKSRPYDLQYLWWQAIAPLRRFGVLFG